MDKFIDSLHPVIIRNFLKVTGNKRISNERKEVGRLGLNKKREWEREKDENPS